MLEKYAFRLFGDMAKKVEDYFPDLKDDLKKANLKISTQEYIAISFFMSFLSFFILLPFLAFFLSIASKSFLFSYLTAILIGIGIPMVVFFIHLNYPKSIVQQREKEIDKFLPFSTLYLNSILTSNLPLNKAFKIYVDFSVENEVRREFKKLVEDIEFYGLDILTALERAINRSPSRKFREFLYGILATLRSGGNLYSFLRERVQTYMLDYKRKLSEFSRSMSIYTQIYLTSIVLGTIFFTILTSLISVLGGTQNIIEMQFLMIFIFLPIVSIFFLFLVKKAEPAWE
ncbi:MAG: type II secretion system F family protein [Candidatus Aenigmatarchaeota archaeon]